MVNSWERLANPPALSSASDSISSGTFTAKKFLYVVIHAVGGSSFSNSLQVGTGGTYDTDSNYARSRQRGGESTDDPTYNITGIDMQEGAKEEYFLEGYISNPDNLIKLGTFWTMEATAGTSDVSNSGEWVFKWDNTAQINTIRLYNSSGGGAGYAAGSKITVWGTDNESTTYTYPDLSNGAIFEESDTGKHYMFDGTSTWNEVK